jgi:hypothetical protein
MFLARPGALSSGLLALRRGRNRKGQAMGTKTMKNAMALGAGGALVAAAVAIATAGPSWAMPVLSNTAAVITAASNPVTDVRYYRHRYYRHRYYGRRYYGRGYRYPWWGYPHAYPYYNYSYYYPYYYPYYYSYSLPFGWDWGWSWGFW